LDRDHLLVVLDTHIDVEDLWGQASAFALQKAIIFHGPFQLTSHFCGLKLGGKQKGKWKRDISRLFSSLFSVSELGHTSLSFNNEVTNGESLSPRLLYPYSDSSQEKKWENVPVDDSSSESQHSDEAGVFISQAALDKLKEEQAAGRKLLQIDGNAVNKNFS